MAISLGLVPFTEPKLFKQFTVGGAAVVKGQPVKLASGLVVDAIESGTAVMGVAMEHAAAGGTVTVCIDPDVIYEALAEEAFAASDVGKFVAFTDSSASSGDYSNAVLDLSAAAATSGAGQYMKVVGNSGTVGETLKVLVKLVPNVMDLEIDA